MERALELSGQNPQDFQDAMIPKGMKHLNFFSDEGLKAIIPAATGVFTAQSLAKSMPCWHNKASGRDKTLFPNRLLHV